MEDFLLVAHLLKEDARVEQAFEDVEVAHSLLVPGLELFLRFSVALILEEKVLFLGVGCDSRLVRVGAKRCQKVYSRLLRYLECGLSQEELDQVWVVLLILKVVLEAEAHVFHDYLEARFGYFGNVAEGRVEKDLIDDIV